MSRYPLRKRGPLNARSTVDTLGRAQRPSPVTVLPDVISAGHSNRLLAHESRAAQSFTQAFQTLMGLLDLPEILDALTSGDWSAIIDILDWFTWETNVTDQMTDRVKVLIETEGRRSFDETMRLAIEPAAAPPLSPPPQWPGAPPTPGPGSGFYASTRFDMTNPFAVRQAEQFAADLVREVSRSTRRAIREAVVDSFRNGVTADVLARRLRNTIGLTERQGMAVENYRRRLLRAGDLDEDRIDVLTDRYYRRMIRRRAETIARTEVMRASNFGRLQGWLSAADAGALDRNLATKEWITAPSASRYGPPCPSCGPMDGVKVIGLETEFNLPGGRTLAMPPAHPNCRCTAVVWPPEPPPDFEATWPPS